MLMEHLTDRFFGDVGEASLAQGTPQQQQRPRRRLVSFPIWLSLHLGQDACLLLTRVGRLATPTRRNREGGEAVGIEALDQLAYAACLFEARHTCRLRKGLLGGY
jgi:hypothetical protein